MSSTCFALQPTHAVSKHNKITRSVVYYVLLVVVWVQKNGKY
jgi:hypothetical protein